ncbi:MAG: hypothetical protein ABIH23_30945, partial [bacterium]
DLECGGLPPLLELRAGPYFSCLNRDLWDFGISGIRRKCEALIGDWGLGEIQRGLRILEMEWEGRAERKCARAPLLRLGRQSL